MSNKVNVNNYEDNVYGIDSARLVNALVLKYANPLVSVPFVCRRENDHRKEELCKQAKMSYENGQFYDNSGNLITRDIMIGAITTDLCSVSKSFLDSEEDKVYHANMVKYILKHNVLPTLETKNDKTVLTVDDLMSKLYNVTEEKGSMLKW